MQFRSFQSVITKAAGRYLVISFFAFHWSVWCGAQPVYVKEVAPFTAVFNGESEWVDLDNDNDLDLIFTGDPKTYVASTLVYENINGSFTLRTTALPNTHYGSFAFGDYDKDGDLDILISSTPGGTRRTDIFRNDGGFIFTQQATLQGLTNTNVAWFDLDNDEDLDLVITGLAQNNFSSYVTLLYENTGTGFVQLNGSTLPDCLCAVEPGDANGDGKTDIMLTGVNVTALYLNKGNKTFRKDENSAFRQNLTGAGKWGDFDGDGDQDIVLTGNDANNIYYSSLYENTNGNTKGSFVERTDIPLLGMGANEHGSQWFDYNNDGRLDLLITGRTLGAGGQTHRLYKNNGGGSFTETLEPSFANLDDNSLDVGDFDNDGDFDISFCGYYYAGPPGYPVSGYYKNTLLSGGTATNTIPQPPSSATFTELFYRREIRLGWGAGSDAQTPAQALTYNFYMRDDTKKIIVPAVDFTTGYLRATNPANGFGKRGFANDVPEGPLYYAVQSIDGAKAGSTFSAEKMIYHFNGPESVHAEIVDDSNVNLTWLDHSALETNFDIIRSTSSQTGFAPLATLPANAVTYTDHFNFLTETYYYYRINAYNASHTSPYDSLILMIPERPTDLVANGINATTIALTWKDQSQYETGFRLERKLSTGSVFETIAVLPPNTVSYDDEGVVQCTSYDYRVRAISDNGGLLPLTTASAKTNCLPTLTNFQKEALEDTRSLLSHTDFESKFNDADAADHLVRVKIASLPAKGSLLVSGAAVTIGQEITLAQLDHMTFDPEANFNGTPTFSAYVHDGTDYSASTGVITLNVSPVNDPPAFELAGSMELEEDFGGQRPIQPLLIAVPYEINDNITYSLSPATSEKVNVLFDSSAGTIWLTAAQNQFGEIEFTVTADDGHTEHNTFSKTIRVTIRPVNDPPVIEAIANTEAPGGRVTTIKVYATDVDNIITASMFSAFSTNFSFLKDENISFVTEESGIYMKLIPERTEGMVRVFVEVNDGNKTAMVFFDLTVISAITDTEETADTGIRIYPNPVTTGALMVWLAPSFHGQNNLVLCDLLGRELTAMKLLHEQTEVNLEDFVPGVYLLTVTTESGARYQRKIVRK